MGENLANGSNTEVLTKDTKLLCGTKHSLTASITGTEAYKDKIIVTTHMRDTGGITETGYHYGNGYLHKIRVQILNDGKIAYQDDISGDDTGNGVSREYLINGPGRWDVQFLSKSSGDCAKPTGTKYVGYFRATKPAEGDDDADDADDDAALTNTNEYAPLIKTGLILGAALVLGKMITKKSKKAEETFKSESAYLTHYVHGCRRFRKEGDYWLQQHMVNTSKEKMEMVCEHYAKRYPDSIVKVFKVRCHSRSWTYGVYLIHPQQMKQQDNERERERKNSKSFESNGGYERKDKYIYHVCFKCNHKTEPTLMVREQSRKCPKCKDKDWEDVPTMIPYEDMEKTRALRKKERREKFFEKRPDMSEDEKNRYEKYFRTENFEAPMKGAQPPRRSQDNGGVYLIGKLWKLKLLTLPLIQYGKWKRLMNTMFILIRKTKWRLMFIVSWGLLGIKNTL